MRENEFHELLREAGLDRGPSVLIGHGDDMACVSVDGARVLVSSDMLLEGRHFDLDTMTPEQVGRKALACCLSDCAAMAVQPVCAVVSLAVRRGSGELAVRVMSGMRELVEAFDCPVVGGDTVSWEGAMAIDVSVVARMVYGVEPVRRSGARVGDGLYVTGRLGGSLRRHHWSFQPRVREAIAIRRTLGARVHAMMDLSDGLAMDLRRMCAAGGVGAELNFEALVGLASEDVPRSSGDDAGSIMAHVLGDGEDFELLVAIDGEAGAIEGVELVRMGEVVAGDGIVLRAANGSVSPVGPAGYEHLL